MSPIKYVAKILEEAHINNEEQLGAACSYLLTLFAAKIVCVICGNLKLCCSQFCADGFGKGLQNFDLEGVNCFVGECAVCVTEP
jgi:hypothetical protein